MPREAQRLPEIFRRRRRVDAIAEAGGFEPSQSLAKERRRGRDGQQDDDDACRGLMPVHSSVDANLSARFAVRHLSLHGDGDRDFSLVPHKFPREARVRRRGGRFVKSHVLRFPPPPLKMLSRPFARGMLG
eukprot:31074-Pelagococcus_subviridis.AAC.21